jgi:ATP-dependent DNA ligase
MLSTPIYKRDTAGKLRTWQYEVDGEKYRTIAGIEGGNLVTSAWTTCSSKNAGKSNYLTAYQQAELEAVAEENKKLKREYRSTIAELDYVKQGPMLAATYKGGLKFPVFSQPKLDGIRALISKDGALTRELQPHFNVAHILEELAPLFESDPNLVLDGELYNHHLKDNFNKICQLVRKQTVTLAQADEIEKFVQFHVYDIASSVETFSKRAAAMLKMSGTFAPASSIRFVHTNKLSSQEALDEQNGIYTSQGYEGQMVRLDAPYEPDTRSKTLLKRKEFDTSEFKLLKIEEGEGNWAGYAKKIVFELEDGRQCGGGIRGDQDCAKELLARWPDSSMSHVTVRYFKRTPDGMPRFPVAIDFHNGRKD